MIKSFQCAETKKLFMREKPRKLPESIFRGAARKLEQIHFARSLRDLEVPPGNRLERLRGDRAGQHSIRVNAQWRICFTWRDGDAYGVEIVDYH
jgi:toxin HigB-1